jgi:glycosyltransferase involved in cell wall biosynthesis
VSGQSPRLRLSKPHDKAPTNAPEASACIVIDALPARYGGTAYTAIQLAHRLADASECGDVVLVTRAGSLIAKGVQHRPGLHLVSLPDLRRFELGHRVFWEARDLPKLLRDQGVGGILSLSGMLPRSVAAPVVCYLTNPVMLEGGGITNRLRQWAARRTLRDASHVLVPSHAMAVLVAEMLGRQPEVVPLGVDHAHFQPASEFGSDVLCVADFYRHKRHDVLLDAWAATPSPRPRLRLIGNPEVDHAWYTRVERQAERLRDRGRITFESSLPLGELVAAYQGARVFALASEHESFCLPLLEAQASGVPAVVRDSPALRETGGEGTTYVGGDDPRDWSAALVPLLSDDAAHGLARRVGLDHARGYSWERTETAVRARLLEAKPGAS